MYVDESGDTGLARSPTSYFALSGLVLHERRWRDFLDQLIALRKLLRINYRLPVQTEIHATEFINGRVRAVGGSLIPRPDKLAILKAVLDQLVKLDFISITNVIVDKTTKSAPYDVFDLAWHYLFQRFENTLVNRNFPGKFGDDYGMVITDATSGKKLLRKVRKMAVYNPIPNRPPYAPGYRNIPIKRIIEDPFGKDSGAQYYFDQLRPVLNRVARLSHPLGIVVL